MWDTFHGSLASHKCRIWCLTSNTVCMASTRKEIDAVLKNKWSVGNFYLVIFFLSVYFFKKSVKFIFEKILFDGAGLLVNYPPKKFRENRTTDKGVTHILRH